MFIQKAISFIGIFVIMFALWLFSENRKKFPFRVVIWGLILQFSIGALILNFPAGIWFFQWLGDQVSAFLNFSLKGASFLFGNLPDPAHQNVFGYQFAIVITATVVFFSAFVSVLYHYKIMQKLVYAMAWVMEKTMGTSGTESLSATSNIFLGQTEAPLMIRYYLPTATRSEIHTIMVGGFATIAGGVMAAYIQMGIPAEQLITASLISVPGGLMLSKILVPPEGKTLKLSEIQNVETNKADNALIALTDGAGDGLKLALNIMAMLIAFVSVIAIVDQLFLLIHQGFLNIGWSGFPETLKGFFGLIFSPFAYIVGIPQNEVNTFASLLGTKISLNEFIAYADLSQLIHSGAISPRTARLASFALCGFANFSSIAIQIGGLGSLAPTKKSEIAKLGFKGMFVGALVNILTATVAGILI
jgi:CNT family concentrative nucleoside transporter